MIRILKKILLEEDPKNPFTDAQIAEKMKIRREQVLHLRTENKIADSRERRKNLMIADAKEILYRNQNISERKFADLLISSGYKVSRYVAAGIKKEILAIVDAEESEEMQVLEKKESPDVLKEPFSNIIGHEDGLKIQVDQAKAAILYPPNGLHTLLIGASGVGKSYLAESMFLFAKEEQIIHKDANFILFNCADYADNPQLLLSQLFGYVKGAFSGAVSDKVGLVEKADGSVLFLDEVHRLPKEGQEILFSILDKGTFRRLGETAESKVQVRIIAATTENLESSLLLTFRRRIPMIIDLPSLAERSLKERYALICKFLRNEALQTKRRIKAEPKVIEFLLLYKCQGNVGQLLSDIRVACANAFLSSVSHRKDTIYLHTHDLGKYERLQPINSMGKKDLQQYVQQPLIFDGTSTGFEIDKELIHKWTFESIYNVIEDDAYELRSSGIGEREINEILQRGLQEKIKEYMRPENGLAEAMYELESVVDKKIVDAVRQAVDIAQTYIPALEKRVYYFLSIHLSTLYERIAKGAYKKFAIDIENIKLLYPMEYKVAKIIMMELERQLHTDFPREEIAMIAMYLRTFSQQNRELAAHVKVIVLSHGRVASAMTEVANRLLNMDAAIGIDMDFKESPKDMLKKVSRVVEKVDEGKGCLLLVDIGSLTSIANEVTELTGIPTVCVDRVDTAMVLEAIRRTTLSDTSLSDVAWALREDKFFLPMDDVTNLEKAALVFICLTGEGTAQQLKNHVIQKLNQFPMCFEMLTISALNQKKMWIELEKIHRKYRIVCIMGNINPQFYEIPFFSAQDIFQGKGIIFLQNIARKESQKNVRLEDVMCDDFLICKLDLADKTQVIDKMASILQNSGYVEPAFLLSAYKRESIGATYLSGGIGIPHGEAIYVKKPAVVVASLLRPIVWENNYMVDLVFLFALREDDQKYINKIYQIISNKESLNQLKNAAIVTDMKKILFKKQN